MTGRVLASSCGHLRTARGRQPPVHAVRRCRRWSRGCSGTPHRRATTSSPVYLHGLRRSHGRAGSWPAWNSSSTGPLGRRTSTVQAPPPNSKGRRRASSANQRVAWPSTECSSGRRTDRSHRCSPRHRRRTALRADLTGVRWRPGQRETAVGQRARQGRDPARGAHYLHTHHHTVRGSSGSRGT
jgi:hypothetical protein